MSLGADGLHKKSSYNILNKEGYGAETGRKDGMTVEQMESMKREVGVSGLSESVEIVKGREGVLSLGPFVLSPSRSRFLPLPWRAGEQAQVTLHSLVLS